MNAPQHTAPLGRIAAEGHCGARSTQGGLRPTLRATLLMLLGLPAALATVTIHADLWVLWAACLGGALALLAVESLIILPGRSVGVALWLPETLYIGEDGVATVTLTLPEGRRIAAEIKLEAGPLLAPSGGVIEAGAGRLELTLSPQRRGMAHVHALWLRWRSPLGMMERVARVPVDVQVPITPNVKAVKAAAIRLFQSSEFLTGLKHQRYIGDGSEFEALREYRPGLDHRAMDWKASARHRKLLCRQFRAERNHQIYLAFDTGHLMGEAIDGMPKLDHAINAGLLLAYYSLKSGDRIGLFGFDEQVRLMAEPEGGIGAIHNIQRRIATLDYSPNETNFTLGLTHLLSKLRRRSLVVVLTDFVDTTTADLMVDNLHRLARRHLVIFVSLRDPTLNQLTEAAPSGLSALHQITVCEDLIRDREAVIKRLSRRGVFCIDAPPSGLTVDLLNRYLEIKRRELL